MRSFLVFLFAIGLATSVAADEITESLELAIEYYEEGDVAGALDELAYTTQLLTELKAQGLGEFMPEPPEGWTMRMDEDPGLAGAFGGGIVAVGIYTHEESGDYAEITMMADNAVVNSMGMMLGNSTMMASLGKIVRIKRQNFVDQGDELSGMIGKVLIQANISSGDTGALQEILEGIDFRELDRF